MSKGALKDHLRRTIGIIESFQSRKFEISQALLSVFACFGETKIVILQHYM